MHKNKPTPKMRPLTTGIISTFLLTSSAFSSDDLPLTVAHRLVQHAIELQSSTSPDNSSSLTRKLSHADSNDSSSTSCSICYDGNDPYHPDRRLELYIDDVVGSPDDSGQLSTSQDLLTCMDYESTFLTKLFPEDSSCRAFQVRGTIVCRNHHACISTMTNSHHHILITNFNYFRREVWPTSVVVPVPHPSARCVNLERHHLGLMP